MKVHSLTRSYTPGSIRCASRVSFLSRPLASPCLGHKPKVRVATCNNNTNKFPTFLCLCNLVKLNETFKVWWSWVGIINYIIRIVLVFDGFFNYHFELCQKMKNSLFVFGF